MGFYTRKAHFDTALLPIFVPFMPVRHIAKARDLGNAAETNHCKHIARAPFLVAEKLRLDHSATNERPCIVQTQRFIARYVQW